MFHVKHRLYRMQSRLYLTRDMLRTHRCSIPALMPMWMQMTYQAVDGLDRKRLLPRRDHGVTNTVHSATGMTVFRHSRSPEQPLHRRLPARLAGPPTTPAPHRAGPHPAGVDRCGGDAGPYPAHIWRDVTPPSYDGTILMYGRCGTRVCQSRSS